MLIALLLENNSNDFVEIVNDSGDNDGNDRQIIY